MTDFFNLLYPDAGPVSVSSERRKSSKPSLRGCEYCPRNDVKGIKKIIGKVTGEQLFVWAQSPGFNENEKGKELCGKSGKWFWERMAEANLHREDCDIQNVMRCWPETDGQMRDPSKEELFCCSIFTDQAILQSRAKVHLVLGAMAADQLFGIKRQKDQRIFWSDKMKGKVILVDHPAYFLRGAPRERLQKFKDGLKMAAEALKEEGGKFGYLKKQDYVAVTTAVEAIKYKKELQEAAKKVRLSADIEWARVNGKKVCLCYGFSAKPGTAKVFFLHHPLVPMTIIGKLANLTTIRELLEDPNIRKVFQHGSSDVIETREILDIKVLGYDYDTNYAEYFKYPRRRHYSLAEIATVRYPEFLDYKDIILPEAIPEGMTYDEAMKAGKIDLSKLSLEKITLYNGADCDITKRIEISTKDVVPLPLLHVYMDAAFTLDKMEENGPWFDYEQHANLEKIWPPRVAKLREELQLMAGDPNFNPGSPAQVSHVLYDVLKLPILNKDGIRDTTADTLDLLADEHPFPKKETEFRGASKIQSTYLTGYKRCADLNEGRLHTFWWLTGTGTGRLSSGGGAGKKDPRVINLQNIHGDKQLQNMLQSDREWRQLYQAWTEAQGTSNWWKPFESLLVYLILDYSQNEIRFLAQTSQDPLLIQQFNSGEDIHCQVGHELTGWSVEKIAKDKETRVLVKNLHFGMIYGLTTDGMWKYLTARGVDITRERVKELMFRYFKRYKKVREYIDSMHEMALKKGYVENILGFRVPIDVSDNPEASSFWRNQAINSPIQGGAHQLLLMALAALTRKPKTYSLIRVPNMEVHDALVASVKVQDLRESFLLAKQLLEKEVDRIVREDFKIDWKIPFVAEAKAAFRYGVQVDYDSSMKTSQFLENWCLANQKSEKALRLELKKIAQINPV